MRRIWASHVPPFRRQRSRRVRPWMQEPCSADAPDEPTSRPGDGRDPPDRRSAARSRPLHGIREADERCSRFGPVGDGRVGPVPGNRPRLGPVPCLRSGPSTRRGTIDRRRMRRAKATCDAPQRTMPELSSADRRLARRVVQDRGAIALSGAGGTGLPLVSATCRVSRRKDRAGTAQCAHDHAACGPGRSVGRIPGDLGGRNAARLYIGGRGRDSVHGLLDAARGPASQHAATKETRRTVR
jgi:hypothetical protein